MNNLEIRDNLINLVLKAEHAHDNELRLVRKTLIGMLNKIGAKSFVDTVASILKNNFQIEGCNDVRMPLKRIFSISLEELEDNLRGYKGNLSLEHPISYLITDHKDSVKKLKIIRFSLGRLNLNQNTTLVQIKDKAKQAKDYYAELDTHIKKEEEILFPVLEQNGMQEHPQNLREEHKGFREILAKIINGLEEIAQEKSDLVIEEIRKAKEKFISDISNHIFRETYIFYPATIEFITDRGIWERIKEGFSLIQ